MLVSPTMLRRVQRRMQAGDRAGPHARALHLAGVGVDPLAGDLPSMLVKSHYDAH
jgi:hypothetical protein